MSSPSEAARATLALLVPLALVFGAGCGERRAPAPTIRTASENPFADFAAAADPSASTPPAASPAGARPGRTLRLAETAPGMGRPDALHAAMRALAGAQTYEAPRSVRGGWEITLPALPDDDAAGAALRARTDRLASLAREAGLTIRGEVLDLPLALDEHRNACGSCGYALFQRLEATPGVEAVEVFLPVKNQLRLLAVPGVVDAAQIAALTAEAPRP